MLYGLLLCFFFMRKTSHVLIIRKWEITYLKKNEFTKYIYKKMLFQIIILGYKENVIVFINLVKLILHGNCRYKILKICNSTWSRKRY